MRKQLLIGLLFGAVVDTRRMRSRRLLTALVVVAATLTVPASVLAIIGGEPTGAHRYSNVGWMDLGGCSGTLVSPTVFLTAAHCVVGEGQGASTKVSFAPTLVFDASDELVGPSIPGTAYFDVRFLDTPAHGGTKGFLDQTAFDLAVVIFPSPAGAVFDGIMPAVLPPLDLLDSLPRSAKAKDSAAFTSVGYGLTREARGNPQDLTYDGVRRMATGPLYKLEPAVLWIKGHLNAAWADGSECYGDSGGADFLGDTDTLVAVHSFGNQPCNLGGGVRLDTASARSFLDDYVSLP